jgi:ABC-type polysaccharide/polyol phosphate export permease
MCGLLPWMMFVEIVSRSPSAVLEQASLIKKSVFPSEILLVAHVTTAMVNHVIMFGLVILFVVFEGMGLSWRIFWLPVYLAGISLLALGLGWMLSSLNIFMRDIGQVLGVILNIWFYLTPVVYPIEMVPDSYKRLLAFNPMLYPIEGYRMALLGRGETNLAGLAILFSCGLLVALFGGLLFKRLKPAFPDVL